MEVKGVRASQGIDVKVVGLTFAVGQLSNGNKAFIIRTAAVVGPRPILTDSAHLPFTLYTEESVSWVFYLLVLNIKNF
jgi:hypothetical protein